MYRQLIHKTKELKPFLKKVVPPGMISVAKAAQVRHIQKGMQSDPKKPYDPEVFPFGMNLIGPIDAATGLGQSFRLVERAVEAADIPYLIYPWSPVVYNRCDASAYEEKIVHELKYSVNLWHVSPLEFGRLYKMLGREAFDCHYNIAYWLWELEDFPDEWVGYAQVLDEIWTPSEFISEALRKKVSVPVYTIPYWISAEIDLERYGRDWFHLPKDRFLFLMMYDRDSVAMRKNPDSVIRAFRKAFPPEREDVGLVIKAGSLSENEYQELSGKLSGYRNINIIKGTLEKIEVNSLIACCDVLVSLHRAEGFGLVLAEAMYNSVPVIATNWSANTEFMNESCACMVPYRLVELRRSVPPYKRGNRWAEPSVNRAAYYMRKLAEHPKRCSEIGKKGRLYVREQLGRQRILVLLQRRMKEISSKNNL